MNTEEKGIWKAEAWETPDVSVETNNGKEKKQEFLERNKLGDETVFSLVRKRLGIFPKGKTICVVVDGIAVKPSEAETMLARESMKILITNEPFFTKKKTTATADAPAYPTEKTEKKDDRKYHQHRGINGSHKLTDKHKEFTTQRYHDNEIKLHETS